MKEKLDIKYRISNQKLEQITDRNYRDRFCAEDMRTNGSLFNIDIDTRAPTHNTFKSQDGRTGSGAMTAKAVQIGDHVRIGDLKS